MLPPYNKDNLQCVIMTSTVEDAVHVKKKKKRKKEKTNGVSGGLQSLGLIFFIIIIIYLKLIFKLFFTLCLEAFKLEPGVK